MSKVNAIKTNPNKKARLSCSYEFISKNAKLSSSSFARTNTNCTPITKIHNNATANKIKNIMNLAMLFFPTQLFIHGQ